MADTFIPVRISYSGSTPVGFAEYQNGENIIHNGGVTLVGAGRRFTADFSSSNPLAFQDGTTNTRTLVYAMPNGTATEAGYVARNASSTVNAAIGIFRATATSISLESNVAGPATKLPMTFWTSGSERARILTSGQVLIGATSLSGIGDGTSANPGVYLQSGSLGVQSPALSINMQFSKVSTAQPAYAAFYFSGNVIGSITTTGSATAYNTTSDYRLKTDVEDLLSCWEYIKALRPVKYHWKDSPDIGLVSGFIAHEVQEVFPEVVTGEKDATHLVDILDEDGKVIGSETVIDPQQVNMAALVPSLVAAVKSLIQEVETLRIEVDTLKGAASND